MLTEAQGTRGRGSLLKSHNKYNSLSHALVLGACTFPLLPVKIQPLSISTRLTLQCPLSIFILTLACPLTGGRSFPSLVLAFLLIPLPFPAKDGPQDLIAEQLWCKSTKATKNAHFDPPQNQLDVCLGTPPSAVTNSQTHKPSEFPTMEYWFQLEITTLIFGPF